MDGGTLARLIQQPEVQRRVIGNYSGPFSLGVTLDPAHKDQPAIMLRIGGDSTTHIPQSISLNGEEVAVIAHPNFATPTTQ